MSAPAPPVRPDAAEDARALADYLAAGRAPSLAGHRVEAVQAAGQGMSDRSLIVTLATPSGGRRRVVLRVARTDGLIREETDPHRNYRTLRALADSAIPVPRALFYEADHTVLGGAFFAMDWVSGHVPVPWSPQGRAWLRRAGSTRVADQFARILAEIHRHDWRPRLAEVLTVHPPGTAFAQAKVAELRNLLDRYRVAPEPILTDALHWLAANLPAGRPTTLVHGDYRTGNLIYRDGAIAAVLDWEFAALGDPMFDIAWVCCRSNRMGSDLVCYLMPREEFYDRYAQAGGAELDEQAVHFWEVYHQLRHTLIWISGGRAYLRGRIEDLRLARMSYSLPTMRRMVADLLDYP